MNWLIAPLLIFLGLPLLVHGKHRKNPYDPDTVERFKRILSDDKEEVDTEWLQLPCSSTRNARAWRRRIEEVGGGQAWKTDLIAEGRVTSSVANQLRAEHRQGGWSRREDSPIARRFRGIFADEGIDYDKFIKDTKSHIDDWESKHSGGVKRGWFE